MLAFLADSEAANPEPPIAAAVVDMFSDLSTLIEDHPDPQLAAKIAAFSALPQGIKSLVAGGQLDLKSATRVRSLPEEVISKLQASTLTFSKRRQFLNELFEVSRKRGLSQAEIRRAAEQAFQDPQPLETVHRLRFPSLTDLERRFAALEEQLLKGSGVRVEPPPYFEGDAFTVEFEFNSVKSFNRKLDALHALEGSLDALFELLY
jgi:ParB-like chromosome segregation protein Spo0J